MAKSEKMMAQETGTRHTFRTADCILCHSNFRSTRSNRIDLLMVSTLELFRRRFHAHLQQSPYFEPTQFPLLLLHLPSLVEDGFGVELHVPKPD
jgi:hypothetical protein